MKILLADDERLSRRLFDGWLAKWGYDVVSVSDGQSALEALLQPDGPKLALLDWVMPKMDGLEVCRHIRATPSDLYVYMVLLTARDDREHIVQGLESGADDYIIKPCNPLELELRLRTGRRVVELQTELVRAQEALRHQANHDPLTGLLNRRSVLSTLEREMARSRRSSTHVSVILCDLDHFKQVNDTYGHPAGDAVLCKVAECMQRWVRNYDLVSRYGGEEFLIVLPDADSRQTMIVAERVRRLITNERVAAGDAEIGFTMSMGVAGTDQNPTLDYHDLIECADSALYRAKDSGRNRVALSNAEDWRGVVAQAPAATGKPPSTQRQLDPNLPSTRSA